MKKQKKPTQLSLKPRKATLPLTASSEVTSLDAKKKLFQVPFPQGTYRLYTGTKRNNGRVRGEKKKSERIN